MPDELFRNKYRNDTARATWHDYNGGEYFITICTKNREHHFGEIFDGTMQLSALGKYADEQLRHVASHYPYAEIPLWVVMPNHIHAVVIIRPELQSDDTPHVRTMCTSSLQNNIIDEKMQFVSHHRGLLSTTIGGLKRAITRYARQQQIPFAWQTRFHDHIIRDTDEMNRIAKYIENNVAKWEYDELF